MKGLIAQSAARLSCKLCQTKFKHESLTFCALSVAKSVHDPKGAQVLLCACVKLLRCIILS